VQQPTITDKTKDPLGLAVLDYFEGKLQYPLTVQSSMFDDDELPVPYLFRTFEEMPELEQKALTMAKGKILDVGAGAGCHSRALQKMGKTVSAIDISPGAVELMQKSGVLSARHRDFFALEDEQYDTILFLMNGAGVAGTVDNLPVFFEKLKTVLAPQGQVLIDSSDVAYLYEDEDGAIEIDINAAYYGEFDFTFSYGKNKSDLFRWFYVDFETLSHYAQEAGFTAEMILEDDNNGYLVRLTL
jgi:protein-L-isoaspartate O-methyltransferase